MRFFRSTWLQRILLFLLLVLLNASPFAYIEQQRDGKDDIVIHSPRSLAELSVTFQKLQIKYGFDDVVLVSVVTIFKKIISDNYIPGTSFDPLSADFLTYPDRGPPRLITIL